MAQDVIRITLADDHPIVREGLAIILNNQPDMQVVAECGDGEAAVAMVLRERPDVAVLDLQMPRMSGAAATVAILQRYAEARILLLTTYDGDEDIHRAMQAGAKGYLLKESAKAEILLAIREVARGKRYVTPSAGASLASGSTLQQLTKREREILRFVCLGRSNKEIGSALNISEGTVKSHVNGIMQKMNVGSRTEAALSAERRGMLRD